MKNLRITVNGTAYDVQVEELSSTTPAPSAPPAPAAVGTPKVAKAAPVAGEGEPIKSPMPGTIVSVNVTNGQQVKEGDVIAILEAMKMENEIMASKAGTITSVCVSKGESVVSGTVIVTIR